MTDKVSSLLIKLRSLTELENNWDGEGAPEISISDILTMEYLIQDISSIFEFMTEDIMLSPMRDGGIQLEIGDLKEIEVHEGYVTTILYDKLGNVVTKEKYLYDKN